MKDFAKKKLMKYNLIGINHHLGDDQTDDTHYIS